MKIRTRDVVVRAAVFVPYGLISRRSIKQGLVLAADRWRKSPGLTLKQLAISSGGAQLVGWTLGMDFIGINMDPVYRPGLGYRWVYKLAGNWTPTPKQAWTIKVIEVAMDASKAPIEGKLFREVGIIPDAWAFVVTQPLWSLIESADKLSGAIQYPGRVLDREQVLDSLTCIFGSTMRLAMSAAMWSYRDRLNRIKWPTAALIAAATTGVVIYHIKSHPPSEPAPV